MEEGPQRESGPGTSEEAGHAPTTGEEPPWGGVLWRGGHRMRGKERLEAEEPAPWWAESGQRSHQKGGLRVDAAFLAGTPAAGLEDLTSPMRLMCLHRPVNLPVQPPGRVQGHQPHTAQPCPPSPLLVWKLLRNQHLHRKSPSTQPLEARAGIKGRELSTHIPLGDPPNPATPKSSQPQ